MSHAAYDWLEAAIGLALYAGIIASFIYALATNSLWAFVLCLFLYAVVSTKQ